MEPAFVFSQASGGCTSNKRNGAANKVLPTSRRQSFSPIPLRQDAGSTLWFMESLLSFFRMHWDHEPVWAIQSAAGPAHSKTWRKCARLWATRQRLGVRRSSAAFDGSAYSEFVRFMERLIGPCDRALRHEPLDV